LKIRHLDVLSHLEADCKELSERVEELRSQLTAVEDELQKKRIAIEVLSGMLIPSSAAAMEEQKLSTREQVRNVLPTNEFGALTPLDVHRVLGRAISRTNVRKILSRLKNRKGTDVRVTDGRYWREEK